MQIVCCMVTVMFVPTLQKVAVLFGWERVDFLDVFVCWLVQTFFQPLYNFHTTLHVLIYQFHTIYIWSNTFIWMKAAIPCKSLTGGLILCGKSQCETRRSLKFRLKPKIVLFAAYFSLFWNVEILLHFNFAFSQCSIGNNEAFGRQTEFSWVFNFAILSYSQNFTHTKITWFTVQCSITPNMVCQTWFVRSVCRGITEH